MKKILMLAFGLMLSVVSQAQAAFTLPTLPVSDIEAAGVAVAALVAVYVVIRVAIKMIKGA